MRRSCVCLLTATLLPWQAAADGFPKMPWGAPDLQGTWDFRSVTPLERPDYFKDREFLAPDEVAAFEKTVRELRRPQAGRQIDPQDEADGDYSAFFLDQGTRMSGTMRTSLVVDPPDGRLPPQTAVARARMAAFSAVRARAPGGPEDRSPGDRCIIGFNAGPPMRPGAYNNIMEIVQNEDFVAIHTEMVNDHRVIPTGWRATLSPDMRLWKGDSHGAWDGDALVVTTSNFTPHTAVFATGTKLRLTERFTRLDADRLLYEYTVDDAESYTRPWSTALEMRRTDDHLYEYACHEGNYALPLMLSGARRQEREGTKDDGWLPTWSRPRR